MRLSELVRREKPLLQALIDDELQRFEARLGRPVDRHEREVADRLCQAILERGASLREEALRGYPTDRF